MNTLITAANSSKAHALKTLLGTQNILLGDYEDLPELLIRSGKMIKLPDPDQSSYAHQVLTLCLDKDISAIYALREKEAEILLNSKQLFAEYGISIFTDDKIQ